MKVLICGASWIADELLKRMGEKWEVTLIDKQEKQLNSFSSRFVSVVRLKTGDASSPVVLEEAGLERQDYFLALTDDDRVNLAASRFAKEKNVKNIMALVRDPERLPEFKDLGIWAFPMTTFIARKLYHYLQDPRMKVSIVGQGEAEVLEIEIGPNLMAMGRKVEEISGENWRIVGYVRDGQLYYPPPKDGYEEGDRLVILGKPDVVRAVCSVIECEKPKFPLVYGNEMAVALPLRADAKARDIVHESLYLAQHTRTRNIYVLCETGVCDLQDDLRRWSESLDIHIQEDDRKVERQIKRICEEKSVGVVVMPSLDHKFMDSLTKPTLINLAHTLPCPLFVAKASNPYHKILVPYNGSSRTQIALEVAVDLAQQFDAYVAVVLVEEPEFLHGDNIEEKNWMENQLKKVRETGRIHKIKIEECVRQGNVVKEITELSKDFNLMVMGSDTRSKVFLEPHVGELLVRKTPCSVLIVAG